LANRLSASVICGDGTTVEILTAAGCGEADMMVAVSGSDEVNLIACQVAKKHFRVPMTIARVNNPRNFEVMGAFGVDTVYSGTKVLAEMIEQEIEFTGLRVVHEIVNSDRVLCEFVLSDASDACGVALQDYHFIKDMRVVLITTNKGEVSTPVGSSVMKAGDTLMIICPRKRMEAIWKGMVQA